MEGVRNELKVSELNNSAKEMGCQESSGAKYLVWRGGEVESVEEWEKFRGIVIECNNDVCGMRSVGMQRRKGSEWWKKWVGRWPKREELLTNGFREEIELPMKDTGHRNRL